MKNNNSMTALISMFSRAYHAKNNKIKVFDDYVANLLLSEEEYNSISMNMENGINFFNPNYSGNNPLRWIVDNQLSPSPLGRAAFTEYHLENAVKIGAKQYLILAAGYDTFAYRQPEYAKNLNIFEIDLKDTQDDKIKRVKEKFDLPINLTYVATDLSKKNWTQSLIDCKDFDITKISFCSLLGITYYLSKNSFNFLLSELKNILPKGSTIVFDYNDENTYTQKASKQMKTQEMLAKEAGEEMLGGYSYDEMEKLLEKNKFLIYEHLLPKQITEQYFDYYNKHNLQYPIHAASNVNYCLAVKKD